MLFLFSSDFSFPSDFKRCIDGDRSDDVGFVSLVGDLDGRLRGDNVHLGVDRGLWDCERSVARLCMLIGRRSLILVFLTTGSGDSNSLSAWALVTFASSASSCTSVTGGETGTGVNSASDGHGGAGRSGACGSPSSVSSRIRMFECLGGRWRPTCEVSSGFRGNRLDPRDGRAT